MPIAIRQGGSVLRVSDPYLHEESHLKVLRILVDRPDISQRDLAKALGVSLGKANYCLRALIARGLVKTASFTANPNKKQYAYLLTPQGIEEKARVTVRFLKRKQAEFDAIRREIEQLTSEVAAITEGLRPGRYAKPSSWREGWAPASPRTPTSSPSR